MAQGRKATPKDDPKTRREVERVEEDSTPSTPVIYEAVRRLGEEEMSRPATSLWWSGLAGGLSISFSLLAEAILYLHTPETPWRNLITSLGYPVGFLMVVLSRQQLFTENTITVVLPVMANPSIEAFRRGARMWGIVLAANLTGTLFAALLCTWTPVIDPDLRGAMLEVSRLGVMQHTWIESGFRAITAGFLMAAMVWLIPAAGAAQSHIVALMSYVIGVGGFAHIVAGSAYAFLLVANGQLGVLPMVGEFMLPVLVGNIIGGTALFALIAHAQVMKEI
jgi:formate/nitrite transporter FocA (FNT family)